jgi:putative NADH-flavin reductase
MTTITVIGGTGYAGDAIVKEAASRGHVVTALTRSVPANPHEGVRNVQGQASAAAEVIAGADVVIGALSPRGDTAGTLIDTYGRIAQAAAAENAQLIVVGGYSSLRPAPGAPRFAEGDDVPEQFAAEVKEMNAVLESLESTPDDVDWVFVSPAGSFGAYLEPTTRRGTYRLGGEVALVDDEGGSAIGGADFAIAIVDLAESADRHRAHVSVAY